MDTGNSVNQPKLHAKLRETSASDLRLDFVSLLLGEKVEKLKQKKITFDIELKTALWTNWCSTTSKTLKTNDSSFFAMTSGAKVAIVLLWKDDAWTLFMNHHFMNRMKFLESNLQGTSAAEANIILMLSNKVPPRNAENAQHTAKGSEDTKSAVTGG